MKIKIKKLAPNAVVPTRAHESDLCYDVVATSREQLSENVWKYGLGLAFEPIVEEPYPLQKETWRWIREYNVGVQFFPRSSVWKTGLVLSNCVGLIDEDYRGEVSAIFYKVAPGEIYEVGDRIGQIKVIRSIDTKFEEVDELSETERGKGGFGSTGK